jgi:hypothetical protein
MPSDCASVFVRRTRKDGADGDKHMLVDYQSDCSFAETMPGHPVETSCVGGIVWRTSCQSLVNAFDYKSPRSAL